MKSLWLWIGGGALLFFYLKNKTPATTAPASNLAGTIGTTVSTVGNTINAGKTALSSLLGDIGLGTSTASTTTAAGAPVSTGSTGTSTQDGSPVDDSSGADSGGYYETSD